MMHDKADENIKIPNLFYTMDDVVFQWGAIYDVYFPPTPHPGNVGKCISTS